MNAVLITGAAGFLGSHLAEHYLNSGFAVLGLDNFCTGSKSNIEHLNRLSKNFYFIEKDVTQTWGDVGHFVQKTDLILQYVFHFASPASPPHYQRLALETLRVNSAGLQLALEFADQYKARLVFSSTSEIYGNPAISPQAESYWGNVNSFGERSCYDEAKRFGEALIYSYNKKNRTQHGLVRIFNTYGPRMNTADGRVIINFLQQALSNQSLSVYGTGNQTRCFCFVSDLISGIAKYADSPLTKPINLGNDTEFSILALAEIVIKITGSNSKLIFLPLPSDDPTQRKPDLRLAKKHLENWTAEVSLDAGLRKMSQWLQSLE